MSIEHLDWQRSWQYFCLTCHFAHQLGLLDLNNDPDTNPVGPSERHGKLSLQSQQDLVCSLLELQYYFRNFHGMPDILDWSKYSVLAYPLHRRVMRLGRAPEKPEEVLIAVSSGLMYLHTKILISPVLGNEEMRESFVSKILQIDQDFQLVSDI